MKKVIAGCIDLMLEFDSASELNRYIADIEAKKQECQKSKIDDWVDHMKTYYPEYRVMDLTKKSEGVNFRTLVETKDLYDQNIQIVGVINYDLVFRRKYIAHITDFTLLLDESSLICNENAKRSKFILKLQPESVILLSGTPTAGKYERLWSQLKLLGWDINKKISSWQVVKPEVKRLSEHKALWI